MLLACENQYSFDEVKSAEDSGSVPTEVVAGEVCEALNETNHAAGERWMYGSTPRVGITDLGDRPASQEWLPMVHIADPSASESVCAAYAPVEVCVAGSSIVANRTAPDDAECEAGSGRFALQPVQLTDHDEDGNVTVAFQALQPPERARSPASPGSRRSCRSRPRGRRCGS